MGTRTSKGAQGNAAATEAVEADFDGLVGPTHNYAGLSPGNLASARNRGLASNPRAAALQGLEKMRLVADLGIPQAVLPPPPRPDLAALARLGFAGPGALAEASRRDPALLAACASASAMWAANAATISPSADTGDGRAHITPANLHAQFHRSLEAPFTARLLARLFPARAGFAHHPPLPSHARYGDEGAANHMRFAPAPGAPGLEAFVHGRAAMVTSKYRDPRRYPARQSREAGEAVARLHGLDPARTFHLRQAAAAVDAGAFHNDVVAVAHLDLLFCHQGAYAGGAAALRPLRAAYRRLAGQPLRVLEVPARRLPLAEAVACYLFNSQVLSRPDGGYLLLAPRETRENPRARAVVEEAVASGHFAAVRYVDLRQSMRNGGGPACLRLRAVLTPTQRRAVPPGVWMDARLHLRLAAWVGKHYRDRLSPADLADPELAREARRALAELEGILGLPGLYDAREP